MRILLGRLQGLFGLFLLAVMLAGWSGVSEGGGFIGANSTLTVSITADKTTLPINILNVGPSIGNPYTNTVNVTVKQKGQLFAGPINVAIASGLSSGALFYLDGDPEHEQCPAGAECPPSIPVPIAFRQLAFEEATGIVTFHFLASNVPGTVVLTASAQDPVTNKTVSASLTIQVVGGGGGVTGGAPSVVKFVMDPAPVYIRDNPIGTTGGITQNTTKLFQVSVLDDLGQAVPDQGTVHTVLVKMLSNRPNGGEWLSTIDAQGNPQEGTEVLANLLGGMATFAFHSGTLPGTVLISATADRRDNNVDNGIQMGITNYAMIPVGTGEIKSLTFTGPFADVAFSRGNNLVVCVDNAQNCQTGGSKDKVVDWLWNGIYNRILTVIASDPYGNPPPAGTPITFRLIDSPLDMLFNRYPNQGHGQFAITGYNGDPAEGGLEFFAPNRMPPRRTAADTLNPFVVPNGVSYAIADPLCLLMLQDPEIVNGNPDTVNALPAEGRLEYHVGSRIITGRAGNMLTVNTVFNQVSQNVGANVWWTVGCPPHKGNVSNFNSDENTLDNTNAVASTDQSGVATVIMSYPANQVGRRFIVSAESDGGKVGAVMTHWYLGMPNGILTITSPQSLVAALAQVFFAIDPTITNPLNYTPWPGLVQVSQNVATGAAVNLPVTLQVLDGGVCKAWAGDQCVEMFRAPITGVPVAVDIVINDPAEAAAIAAEEAAAQAQAAYDAFIAANPGVCDLVLKDPEGEPEERDPEKCARQKELTAALDAAKIAAVEARALANLHTPTASVSPTTLASVGGGYIRAVLNVNDLPTDGSVDFFFSTVGPSVSSQVLQITVQPPPPKETSAAQ